MIDYITAATDEEYNNAAKLFKEYAEWLKIDLSFQHFDNELLEVKKMYGKPQGAILLCKDKNKFIGCVGIRKIDNDIAELKRMYIKTTYQKQGIGKALLEKAIEIAEALNYKFVRLDTLSHMAPAIYIYKQRGFYEIPAYYYNPNDTAVYFEMKLSN